MKKFSAYVITAIISFTAFSQTWIRPGEATKHKGEAISLVGFVTHVKIRKDSSTVMRVMTNDPKRSLTLVVCNSDRFNFIEAPEIAYLNQYVQVKGLVGICRGNAQIVLHNPGQISIARDSGPEEE